MHKISFTVAFLALPLFAFAQYDDRLTALEQKMNAARDEADGTQRATARFASGRPVYTGYGLCATIDALYWTAFEGGTEYAYSNSDLPIQIGSEVGSVYNTRFGWDAGYRLGLGYSWPEDNWDFALTFTRSAPSAHHSKSINPNVYTFGSLLGSNIEPYTSMDLRWDLKLSILDFECGRSYFVSKYLYLRPHFGLRSAWIHQKATTTYVGDLDLDNITTDTNSFRNDFDGAGLRLGADTKWFLDTHWNVSLASSLSTLYGHFKVANNYLVSGGISFNEQISGSYNRIVPAAQMALGFGWESLFSCEANHIAFNVAYELNYWWRQNQMAYFEDNAGRPYGTRFSDDLGFHGVTFDMQLSF